MKVVLLKDVKGTGRANTAVDVADGFALNMLLPRKLAVRATDAALSLMAVKERAEKDRRELDVKLIEERLSALAFEKLVFRKKANEKGGLYDGLDAHEIAKAAHLPEESIRIERPFKDLGEFEVPVSFGEHFGKFKILIEAE